MYLKTSLGRKLMLLIGVILLVAGAGLGFNGLPDSYGVGLFLALLGTLFFIVPALLLNDKRLDIYVSFFELLTHFNPFKFLS